MVSATHRGSVWSNALPWLPRRQRTLPEDLAGLRAVLRQLGRHHCDAPPLGAHRPEPQVPGVGDWARLHRPRTSQIDRWEFEAAGIGQARK